MEDCHTSATSCDATGMFWTILKIFCFIMSGPPGWRIAARSLLKVVEVEGDIPTQPPACLEGSKVRTQIFWRPVTRALALLARLLAWRRDRSGSGQRMSGTHIVCRLSSFFLVLFEILNVSQVLQSEYVCTYWIGRSLCWVQTFFVESCVQNWASRDYVYILFAGCTPFFSKF